MYCSRCGTQNIDTAKFCRSCGLDLTATTPISTIREQNPEMTEIDMVRDQLKEEYDILDELGRGGMAIVFKARERQLEREVAIKVLPFSLAFDKEFVERFQREARTSAKLEHPGIIPIYRVGKSGRVIYFVMKFLRGKPLSSVLAARGTLPPGEIRQVLVQVTRALAYAHKSGIVHRDIKPDNIMFDEHGLAVVTDFGIAKAASGGKLTGTGMSIGTPHYMSPEQARAQPLDGRSDIYSLGVVAFQCLTGRVPFDGEDSFSIGYKHIMEEIPTPPLETYDQRTLFEVIKKMMAKSPDERFQSADDLVQSLEAGGGMAAVGLATAPTKAIPSLAGARLASGLASAATTPLPRMPDVHKRSVAAGIGLWVVVVAIGLGAPGLYAYKKGLLFFAHGAPADSTKPSTTDTMAQRLLADTGSSPASTDTGTQGATSRPDTARGRPVTPGTPGHLTLQGLPKGARVTLNGLVFRGPQGDVPPGTYRLAVRAPGFAPYDRQVVITAGAASTIKLDLESTDDASGSSGAGEGGGPCDTYGPAYNQDHMCWDARPVPLSSTLIPIPQGSTVFPRPAILLVHVSRDGETIEARLYSRSNLDTFNDQALDVAKNLRWNPAQKNGEPVDAWVQWPFQPVRQ